jgi:protein-S-isoprenylcysteine O-methyltransferase Ste14
MIAQIFWLSYLALAFIIAPAIFRMRFGRWPYAYRFNRPDAYLLIDMMYGVVTIAFTVCLLVLPRTVGMMTGIGLVLGIAAVAIMAWAVMTLDASWRIGHDRSDAATTYVVRGPYRFASHPIYIALAAISTAMILMAGATLCTVSFAIATVIYGVMQGRNESRLWRVRTDGVDIA